MRAAEPSPHECMLLNARRCLSARLRTAVSFISMICNFMYTVLVYLHFQPFIKHFHLLFIVNINILLYITTLIECRQVCQNQIFINFISFISVLQHNSSL